MTEKKYSISFISERNAKTIVSIQTDEELTEKEIISLLEEIRMNLGVYLESKFLW
jgi:hypothetical protein